MLARARLFLRLSRANLCRHRTRWVLTLVGIAIGVASFTGVLAINRSIINAFEDSVVRVAGRAQLQVSNGSAGVEASLVDDIEAVEGVEVASGNVQFGVMVPTLGRRVTIFGVLLGADHRYREAQFGPNALNLPDSLAFLYEVDSIAPSAALLAAQGWKMGTSIDVVGPKGPRTLTVRGRLDAGNALRVFGGDIAVMDSDAAQHAFGELDRFHWVDVVVDAAADIDAVRARLTSAVAGRGVVETPNGRGRRMETMLGTLRFLLTVCGVVAMVVGIFLIHHTVATAIRQRTLDLAKLRALGASRRMLTGHVLLETAAIGLVGTGIGIALGIGFSMASVALFAEPVSAFYAAVPTPRFALAPAELLAALGLGEGTVLLAALIPCLSVMRLRPLVARRQALGIERPSAPWSFAVVGIATLAASVALIAPVGRLGFAGAVLLTGTFAAMVFLGATLLVPALLVVARPAARGALRVAWGLVGEWTWRQVHRRQVHASTTIGALAAGVAFVIGLTMTLGSYRSAFVTWVVQTFGAEVSITAGSTLSLLSGPTLDLTLGDELAHVPGVARVMPWRLLDVEFRGRPIVLQALPRKLIEDAHPGLVLDHMAGEVVISDTLAERFDLAPGDRFQLPAPVAPLTVTVGSVEPDYLLDLGNLKVEWELFVEHYRPTVVSMFAVEAAAGTSGPELKQRLAAAMGGRYDATILTVADLRAMIDGLVEQAFALTYSLELLALLVTVLAMINATSATIIDRTHDLTVWRALGLERRRLARLMASEAAVLGALGGVLGVLAGCFVGIVLVKIVAVEVIGFRMAIAWPIGAMLSVVALTAGAAALTAGVVARRSLPATGS